MGGDRSTLYLGETKVGYFLYFVDGDMRKGLDPKSAGLVDAFVTKQLKKQIEVVRAYRQRIGNPDLTVKVAVYHPQPEFGEAIKAEVLRLLGPDYAADVDYVHSAGTVRQVFVPEHFGTSP